jgi:hypothetical protein
MLTPLKIVLLNWPQMLQIFIHCNLPFLTDKHICPHSPECPFVQHNSAKCLILKSISLMSVILLIVILFNAILFRIILANVILLSIILLSLILLSDILKCHSAHCHSVLCNFSECLGSFNSARFC